MSTGPTSPPPSARFDNAYSALKSRITNTAKALRYSLPGEPSVKNATGDVLTLRPEQVKDLKGAARLVTSQNIVSTGAGVLTAGGVNSGLKRIANKKPRSFFGKIFSNRAIRWITSSVAGLGAFGVTHSALNGKDALKNLTRILGRFA